MTKTSLKIYSLLTALLFVYTNAQAEFIYEPLLSDRYYPLQNQLTGFVLSTPSRETTKVSEDNLIEEILAYITANYIEKVDIEALRKKAKKEGIRAMLKSLDPFSDYLPPLEHKERETEVKGQFGGLGIRIEIKEERLTVITPIPGAPAYRAGILPGDIITEIEGKSTEGISLQEAVRRLRGPPGTSVTIKVQRGTENKVFTLIREIIKIQSVSYRIIQPKIGYLKISEFSGKTVGDVKAILGLNSKGMKKLILDLRDNPGGILNESIKVAKLFIGENKVIATKKNLKTQNIILYRADSKAPFESIPLVVIVNNGSAGGSELLAGALQDYNRAKIVGSRTFGKASIQSVIPLRNGGSLRLTIQHFYTPKDRQIERNEKTGEGGITPDFLIEITKEEEVQLRRQMEEIYAPGKEPISVIPKREQIEDPFLKQALQLLQ